MATDMMRRKRRRVKRACGAIWVHLLHVSPICCSSAEAVIHAPTTAATQILTALRRTKRRSLCTVDCDVKPPAFESSLLTWVKFGSLLCVRRETVQE